MSVTALNWAFAAIDGEGLRPSAALTLLALAHCHNELTGQCDPSLAYLRSKTGLSERGVQMALRELERRRLLLTAHRKQTRMCGAWNRTNSYTLTGVRNPCGGVGQRMPPIRNG